MAGCNQIVSWVLQCSYWNRATWKKMSNRNANWEQKKATFFINWPITLKDLDNKSPNKFETVSFCGPLGTLSNFLLVSFNNGFLKTVSNGAVLTRYDWNLADSFTCHISYKLIVNVNVSKMAFAQKIQVRLNREGGIYGSSRRHSQL